MAEIVTIATDFARITVTPMENENDEFLLEHACHQLVARYRAKYGFDATVALLHSLQGYHGKA